MSTKRDGTGVLIPISVKSAAHYLFSRHDAVKCEEFFDRVSGNIGDGNASSTRLLRNYLILHNRKQKRPALEIFAVTVKAWSSFVRNQPMAALKWTRFGDNPEVFPPFPGDSTSDEKTARGSRPRKMAVAK